MQPAPPDLSKYYLSKNLLLAWPLALNALLMQAMLVIDILLVSPLGEVAIAAMGIATTIIAFFIGVQLALANGSQLIISRVFGAKDKFAVEGAAINCIAINLVFSILFVVLLSLFGIQFIALLTDNPVIAEHVSDYLYIAKFTLLANSICQCIVAYLNGQSNTKTPLKAYLLEVPLNIVLSYLFIYGIADNSSFVGFGVIGAALGSLVAIVIRLAYLLLYLKRNKLLPTRVESDINRFIGLKVHFCEILPIATNFVVLSIGFTIYQLLFAQLSIFSYVAVTLVFPWLKMATLFIVSWAQANSIAISQAVGQNLQSHIPIIIRSCIKAGMVMALVLTLLLFGFSLSIKWIYPNVDPQTYLAAASIAPLYILLPIVRSYNTIAGNSLRALGKSVQVLKIHFTAQWLIILPLCTMFVLYWELPLFWAFVLLPLEEVIKSLPFYLMLKRQSHIYAQSPNTRV